MKFMPMWLQNSTPKPKLVIRLTTKTAFISAGYPPMTTLNIHMIPISSKKTKKTQKAMIKEIDMLLMIYIAMTIAPRPSNTFWKSTPLMYVYWS